MTTWHLAPGWGVVDRPTEGEHGGRLYAAQLLSGEISVVGGATAVVTRAALDGHDLTGIRRVTAVGLGVPMADVDLDVLREVLDGLVSLGLLQAG